MWIAKAQVSGPHFSLSLSVSVCLSVVSAKHAFYYIQKISMDLPGRFIYELSMKTETVGTLGRAK